MINEQRDQGEAKESLNECLAKFEIVKNESVVQPGAGKDGNTYECTVISP